MTDSTAVSNRSSRHFAPSRKQQVIAEPQSRESAIHSWVLGVHAEADSILASNGTKTGPAVASVGAAAAQSTKPNDEQQGITIVDSNNNRLHISKPEIHPPDVCWIYTGLASRLHRTVERVGFIPRTITQHWPERFALIPAMKYGLRLYSWRLSCGFTLSIAHALRGLRWFNRINIHDKRTEYCLLHDYSRVSSGESINLEDLIEHNTSINLDSDGEIPDMGELELDDSRDDFWNVDEHLKKFFPKPLSLALSPSNTATTTLAPPETPLLVRPVATSSTPRAPDSIPKATSSRSNADKTRKHKYNKARVGGGGESDDSLEDFDDVDVDEIWKNSEMVRIIIIISCIFEIF
ncbi:hypothetical protein BC938DRAFT_477441 [Jimgerdemannia flammicorona]|uniref:Uncharacterized protein n=1 Tax=Jimgerdemannia flammicorona TaxID=994334 RepID=A0A433P9T3_9FUNG|nr:hypothetical protein BC938DRAFT_477441 [Jimgerdemannia flammicorona]